MLNDKVLLDDEEIEICRDRAAKFFQDRPDLLAKLRKHRSTMCWTASELSLFDKEVFVGGRSVTHY